MKKIHTMSVHNKKQFGVWMDSHHATIVGREQVDLGPFVVLGHVKTSDQESNSNEKTGNNAKQAATQKFFKEITAYMQNVDEIHVTGTGQVQEQFINYLAETPQYKNVVATESTSNKMSDEKLLQYMAGQFTQTI